MPRADAHLHLFARGFAGPTGASDAGPDELGAYERLRALHGIERGLVVGYEGEPRYAGNSEELLELARTRPWIAPLAYLPAGRPPDPGRLRELRDRGAAGVAVYLPDAAAGRAFAAWPASARAALRDLGAIVSLNATPEATAEIGAAIADLAGAWTLFSHLGLPGRHARPPAASAARARLAPLLALAAHDHVAVKLSGLYAISDPPHDFPHAAAAPFVAAVLEAFGPSRLVWGSDFSPALGYVSFAQTADPRHLAGCTPEEVDAVMGGNLLDELARRSC